MEVAVIARRPFPSTRLGRTVLGRTMDRGLHSGRRRVSIVSRSTLSTRSAALWEGSPLLFQIRMARSTLAEPAAAVRQVFLAATTGSRRITNRASTGLSPTWAKIISCSTWNPGLEAATPNPIPPRRSRPLHLSSNVCRGLEITDGPLIAGWASEGDPTGQKGRGNHGPGGVHGSRSGGPTVASARFGDIG
jgi:hypothetical protein